MSVLLVTDDADDSIHNCSIVNHQEHIYKQIKKLEYDLSSVNSFSIFEHSLSIFDKPDKYYRQHRRRRRRCRPQQCLVQHLLTYMLTLLILTNHLHWPVIFLSLSSIKIMSAHASTITTTTILTSSSSSTSNQTITKRPLTTPSTTTLSFEEDKQCLPIDFSTIDRLCSKTCRARKTPFETFDSLEPILTHIHYLPFCANILTQNVLKENFFNETTESECRETLKQIHDADYEARKAFQLFGTYMQAIDSASDDNRYSIIKADCQVKFS